MFKKILGGGGGTATAAGTTPGVSPRPGSAETAATAAGTTPTPSPSPIAAADTKAAMANAVRRAGTAGSVAAARSESAPPPSQRGSTVAGSPTPGSSASGEQGNGLLSPTASTSASAASASVHAAAASSATAAATPAAAHATGSSFPLSRGPRRRADASDAGDDDASSPLPTGLPPSILPTPEFGILVSTLAGSPHPVALAKHRRQQRRRARGADSASSDDDTAASVSAPPDSDDADDVGEEEEEDEDAADPSVPVALESARFFFPQGLCPSREERHLLLADRRAVRHVNTARKVVGVLSGGVQGAAGLFREHSTGCIWIADTLRHAIRKITPKGELIHVAGSQKGKPGYVNGTALAARFREPMAICTNGADSKAAASTTGTGSGSSSGSGGNGKAEPLLIFIADAGNCCIRMLNEKGQVSTLAGAPPEKLLSGTAASASSAQASSAAPHASAGGSASVLAASVPRVAVDGPLSVATFVRPVCVAFDHGDASLVIADAGAHSLRRLSAAGLVWSMAGCARTGEAGFVDGPAFLARFRSPHGLAIDSLGRCFVADRDNHAIRVLTPAGLVHTIAGVGSPGLTNGAGTSARFFGPTALALDPSGALLVADTNNHVLRRIQFVTLPLSAQRELGNTQQLLLREWAEWQARADVRRKQEALTSTRLERQVLELRRELAETKKNSAAEFAKVRQEQMQIMAQLISSMQAITADRSQRI